eukprot:609909-Pleurochrysis_carterae.AAC.3
MRAVRGRGEGRSLRRSLRPAERRTRNRVRKGRAHYSTSRDVTRRAARDISPQAIPTTQHHYDLYRLQAENLAKSRYFVAGQAFAR